MNAPSILSVFLLENQTGISPQFKYARPEDIRLLIDFLKVIQSTGVFLSLACFRHDNVLTNKLSLVLY